MKNNWYIPALGVLSSTITVMTSHYVLLIMYFCWLFYLFIQQKVGPYLVILVFSMTIAAYYYIPSISQIELDEDNLVTVIDGRIISEVKNNDQTIQFHFEAKETKEKYAVLHFLDKEKPQRETAKALTYGASCSLKGKKTQAKHATNPHQFDYATYLQEAGIKAELHLASLSDIKCLQNSSLKAYIFALRQDLLQQTTEKLSLETATWLHALVLGDKSSMEDTTIELFQRWGLSHILAISGLHIGIIVGLIYFIFVRFSITTKEKAQLFIIIFLPLYALLAGSEPSVLRASWMIVILLIFHRMKITYSYADIISIVFLLLIILDPYIVYHIGFQFSFAVTFGLLLSQYLMQSTPSNLIRMVQISFISQMIILPLQLYYFSIFEPLSIIVNVFIVPYFSLFVIPMMFILLLLTYLPSFILLPFDWLFSSIQSPFLRCLFWIDSHLYQPFVIGTFPFIYFILYYLLFICFMIYYEKQLWKKSFYYGLLLGCLLIFLAIRPYLSPYGKVTMLDIGQGDAIIVELPYRKAVFMIDAGSTFSFHDMEATSKVYEQVIRPYLYGEGIQSLDAIFISHEHIDHHGSVPFIAEQFPTEQIIISSFFDREDAILAQLIQQQQNIKVVAFNENIHINDQHFKVLAPSVNKQDANENSLVLYTEIGGLRWLFTGDIYVATEALMMQQYKNLEVDVLKVAHHGSDTSTSEVFLHHVKPKWAWIGVGRNNHYNHPNEEVIEVLESNQIEVYRTDEDGAIQYRFKGNKGMINTFLK